MADGLPFAALEHDESKPMTVIAFIAIDAQIATQIFKEGEHVKRIRSAERLLSELIAKLQNLAEEIMKRYRNS